MTKINKVPQQLNLPEIEERITKYWKDKEIFNKSVEQRSKENAYVFVDGPPFVSGTPHYGSLLASIAKDVVPRYWTMQGKRVRRVFGWDCHGLPVEEKVSKDHGLVGRKAIEEFGIDNYVGACRTYIEKCTSDWRWYIDRVGRWVDLDNAYYTMHPEFNESVIWAFKQIWDKGLIYKGKRTSMYSTDTATPVSEFEVAMDPDNYQDVQDLSVFVKFQLKTERWSQKTENKEVHIVAWTTTPWTMPSNFALAVNPNVDYNLVEFEGSYYVLAKERLQYTFQTDEANIGSSKEKLVKVLETFKGKELEGLEYQPVYDFFTDKRSENDFKVYLYEGVTIEDGTGVLHIAPAFGEEDFNLGKQFGLSDHYDIDDEGKMIVDPWKGVYLREASPMIAEDLNKKGLLFRSEMYTHRLPFYRGKNPLIYKTQDAYFINVQSIKQRMLELNQKVNWVPEHFKNGRFAQVVETAPDWCISRNRYWATIMPLWQSEDGDQIVVGSFEEMMQYTDQITKKIENDKPVYYFTSGQKMTLHRDVCDKVVLEKNGKQYFRVPEVLDCWMDSGSVPFAEYHYPFENKEVFENAYPSDFIVEYTGQIRAWFNVLFRLATLIFDSEPFKNVVCTGVLGGNDGRKMSKSYGNYPDPKELLEKIGGEALRLYLMGSPVMIGGDADWSDEILNEQVKNILIPVWNTYRYLTIYAELHDWTPTNTEFPTETLMDRWLKSYLDSVTRNYSKAMEAYNIPESVKLIQPTIDNVSMWYIRRSRDRFANGDKDAMQSLYAALVQMIKTFAPQMPFLTEELYQNLVINTGLQNAKESIHLEDYPITSEVDEVLLQSMDIVRKAASLGLNIRDKNQLKLKQPLSKAYVSVKDPEMMDILKGELNVKEVIYSENPVTEEGYVTEKDEETFVSLCTVLTEELKNEGLLNELVRQLQAVRKSAGCEMKDVVKFKYKTDSSSIKSLFTEMSEETRQRVNGSSFEEDSSLEGESCKVGGDEVVLVVEK